MHFSQRLSRLSANVFADMDRAKAKAVAAGRDLIDLSLGSSDLPASAIATETIAQALTDSQTHGYVLHRNTQAFREAIATWYTERYGVAVDPNTEVLALIGSQEGTAHLPLALLDPGDYALLPDPGYPSYAGGVALAGGESYFMPFTAEHHFLPKFAAIPQDILAKSRLMILSYPHNPTTAIATLDFFREAVAFCQAHDLALIHDFPYNDIYFAGETAPPSVLQADPEKTCSIEFFTFSKSFNMGGFRTAFAVGNAQLIAALRQIKAVVDFNQYQGILNGAIAALQRDQATIAENVRVYQDRRDALVEALNDHCWSVPKPGATLYVWAKLPEAWSGTSLEFCTQLVAQTGIALSPGSGFGKTGEGYVRFALVQEPAVLREAVRRIQTFLSPQP
ncbi:LL-diaminopimelate aminotransferase [Picosynechococcus sp. PCC 73109]|uniref:LL-diaminopimelate aminotransferase n=1 Tax=Picosynechococcus sp. PCC 73109 TaxID=374982 RepID=UPI0007457CFD|nr:LL-diaminopimelate aminotransferase [Picosynechococcus sp. PCC 73109]AMA08119.1 succinyldiaminopimelate aminotransferase [Picosynechococcus sp. PCC 73109]